MSSRQLREVVFVDGARTPFGRAGKGIYAETRADDLIVAVIRELLRRHPELPPARVDEVAIAASTQGSFTPLVRSWLSTMARRATAECGAEEDWLAGDRSVMVILLPWKNSGPTDSWN